MWPNPQFPADLVTFTEEILHVKLHFLCSANSTFLLVETDCLSTSNIILLLGGFFLLVETIGKIQFLKENIISARGH